MRINVRFFRRNFDRLIVMIKIDENNFCFYFINLNDPIAHVLEKGNECWSQIKTKSKQKMSSAEHAEYLRTKMNTKSKPHTLNVKFYTKRERTEHVEYKSRTDFSFVGEKCFLCFCRSTWPSSLSDFPCDFLVSHTVRTFGSRTLPKHAAAPVAIAGAAAAQMHGKYTNERTYK